MTTTQRPKIGGKVTRKTEEKRHAELDAGIRITLGGESYEVRMGDVSPQIARELRALTGRGPFGLLEALPSSPDIDLISEFVWLARRLRGEQIGLDEVEVTYADMLGDDFDVVLAGDDEGDEDPEA